MKMNLMKINICKYVIVFSILFLSIMMPVKYSTKAFRQVYYNNLDYTGEIKNVTVSKMEDGFNIDLNTNGYDKGYYTAFFTPGQYINLTGIKALSVNFTNNCDEELKINFSASNDRGEYRLEDGSIVFKKNKSLNILEELITEYGTVTIKAKEDAMLYIPFNALKMENEEFINNFGFSVTTEENKELNFSALELTFLNTEEGAALNYMEDMTIVGSSEVTIPVKGESVEQYRINNLNSKVHFSLLGSHDGIYIDGDGVLHVKDNAKQEAIFLRFKGEDGTLLYKNVNIVSPETSGSIFQLPASLSAKDSAFVNFLTNRSNLRIMRSTLILIVVLSVLIFLGWKKIIKCDYRIIIPVILVYSLFTSTVIVNKVQRKRILEQPKISKTMNIGNALEAPKGVTWDVTMNEEYIDKIKEAGFDAVRIPIRFSDYAKDEEGYILDENFMNKVDYYIEYALSKDLCVIADMHNFIEMMEDPLENKELFLNMWEQISVRYKDYSNKLLYEPLNEPKDNLTDEMWNEFAKEAVNTIRKNDKEKYIILGGTFFNSYDNLLKFEVPNDKKIILTFHYYSPDDFTFQGNEYHEGFENLHDITWDGTKEEVEKIETAFKEVYDFAKKKKLKVFLGEFGANKNAPRESRIRWTKTVRSLAEEYDFAWGYWEMASYFGIYDTEMHSFDEEMLNTLIERNGEE